MNSRMDRYKNLEEKNENTMYGRSSKNKNLYDDSNYDVFSSNETIIDTSNEIDITKLKEIIKSREDYKKEHAYRTLIEDKQKESYDYIKDYNTHEYEEKNYDINTLLNKVIKEKHENNNKKLINTQYDILSKLDVRSKKVNTKEEDDKLQKLIDDIIKKDEEEEIQEEKPVDLLEDLLGDNTSITEGFKDESNKTLPALEKNNDDFLADTKSNKSIDDFLEDSIVFDDDDFEDFKNIEKEHKGNTVLKVIIFVIVVVLCTVAIFVLDSIYHFIPF